MGEIQATSMFPRWLPTADMVNSEDPEIRASQVQNLAQLIDSITELLDQIQATGNVLELGTTVTTEVANGQSAVVGASLFASPTDHTHGTPPLSDDLPEDLGTADAGTAALSSRRDHVHGGGVVAGTGIVSTSDANSDGVSSDFAPVDHVHASGPHPYLWVPIVGGLTPSNSWLNCAQAPIIISGRMTTGRYLSFKWSSTGASVNAEFRLRDVTNSNTLYSTSVASTFSNRLECISSPTLANIVACSEVMPQIEYDAVNAGSITLHSMIMLEGDR